MANFSLKNFTTEVRQRGVAKPTRFEVLFNIPAGLNVDSNAITLNESKLVSLFCEMSALPPQTIGIRNQRIYGPVYQRPFGVDFGGDGITMTFILDQGMDVKAFFDAWMSKIIDPFQYFVYYENSYKTDITIAQLDQKDNYSYAAVLEGAFPRSVQLLELNHSAQNAPHRMNVTFAYRRWTPIHRITASVRYPDTNPLSLSPDPVMSALMGSDKFTPANNDGITPPFPPLRRGTSQYGYAAEPTNTLPVPTTVPIKDPITSPVTSSAESVTGTAAIRYDKNGRQIRTVIPRQEGVLIPEYVPPKGLPAPVSNKGQLQLPVETGGTLAQPKAGTAGVTDVLPKSETLGGTARATNRPNWSLIRQGVRIGR